MKIAFVVNNFPEISQTFVLNQITGLMDRGHDIAIYATGQNRAKIHPDIVRYQLLERVHYPSGPSNGKAVRVVQAVKALALRCLESPWLPMRLNRAFVYGRYTETLRALYLAALFPPARSSYDVIYCHFGPNGLMGALMREMGILQGKLVTVFHGADVTLYLRKLGEDTYGWLFQTGDLFAPISEHWKGRLIHLGCDEKKILVHRMGIDCNKFAFTPTRSLADGEVRIVTVARLTEKKGVDLGIRAIGKLVENHPRVRYEVVGDGPCREALRRLIRELHLDEVVHLLGPKDQSEVIEILRKAHILLAPSITASDGDQEGIPVVLMEGMAMGLPVVSTQHSGIPELIQDGVSGLLAPEGDVQGLMERLDHLIGHPENWPGMVRAAREKAEKDCDIGKLNDRLVDIFRKLNDRYGKEEARHSSANEAARCP
jgi:colanic acid/amylovoran biosynthesis glycosyltransferase